MQARGIDDSSQNVARFERRNVWAGNMKGYQGQRNCLEQRRLDVLKDGRKKKSWIATREKEGTPERGN